MPTQKEIAEHLGISQQAVSAQMAPLGIDWTNSTMTRIRLAYLEHLRAVAAGHRSADGMDLARERALTEQVDRQLKLLQLAEKTNQLVNLAQLEPELARMVSAFRAELLARDDKLKDELDALYGIEVDLELLNGHTRGALAQLARYDEERASVDQASVRAGDAAGTDGDHGVGTHASQAVGEGFREAGDLQP